MDNTKILPIVVGHTGAMPQPTIEALRRRGITGKNALTTISLIALSSSIETYHGFMDYDGVT